jgi:hypothetical protein
MSKQIPDLPGELLVVLPARSLLRHRRSNAHAHQIVCQIDRHDLY